MHPGVARSRSFIWAAVRTLRYAPSRMHPPALLSFAVGCVLQTGACSPSPAPAVGSAPLAVPASVTAPASEAHVPAPVPEASRCSTLPRRGQLTRYPPNATYSPMSPAVVQRLKTVLEKSPGRRNVFMKVGDSMTISNHFLKCFAEDSIDLGAHGHLEGTRRFFNQVAVGPPKTSFNRASLSNRVGWTAADPRRGSPSPLELEITGTRPAFAVIMFGSNGSRLDVVHAFEHDLLADVDLLLGRGIIPLMSTIPPKINKPESMAAIPDMNAIVRAIAQSRQVPLMDYYAALQGLPDFGLALDGVHPQPYVVQWKAHGCWLNDVALQSGMNVRNLLVLSSLDRVRRFLLDGEPPEPEPMDLQGEGTTACPWRIDGLPFADAAELAGSDVVYEVHLDRATSLRIRAFADAGGSVGYQWMNEHSSITTTEIDAAAGTFRLVLTGSGRYRLTVVPFRRGG